MRYPRNVKVFRGQLDAAPWACLFFLLIIFFMLQSELYHPPGVALRLPESSYLEGTTNAVVVLLVDRSGGYFLNNEKIPGDRLKNRLMDIRARSEEPVTLIVQADKNLTMGFFIENVERTAREAGIDEMIISTRPSFRASLLKVHE